MIVPYRRELHTGSIGLDVTAVKRALRKWRPASISNTTRIYGPGAARAVQSFQHQHGLQVDGVYGKATHTALAPYFDAYGAWLLAHTNIIRPPGPRDRVVAAALALYNYERTTGHVHYTQGQARMSIVRRQLRPPFSRAIYEDCSSSVTGYYWIANVPDPNGRHFDGYGFTGTLVQNGVRVETILPGDLILYGPPPYHHVTVAVGDDPTKPTDRCISHGHEGGPLLLDIHYRNDFSHARSYLPR
jgi:peptidoglycan hydrolase-like protein with peptidoglycan-binding domain